MPRIQSTRLYLRYTPGRFARLLWVHNNRPNEMLLGAYALNGQAAIITHEFPERVHATGDHPALDFKYADATRVEIKIDHFTCHADGRFHAKTRGGDTLYTQVEELGNALGPDSPPFLRVLVVSDKVRRYAAITGQPKRPHVWVEAEPDAILALNCVFSGVNHPLEARAIASMAGRGRTAAGVVLISGTLKGVVWGSPRTITPEAATNRPEGTLIVFSWPRGDGRWGFKAFILN